MTLLLIAMTVFQRRTIAYDAGQMLREHHCNGGTAAGIGKRGTSLTSAPQLNRLYPISLA